MQSKVQTVAQLEHKGFQKNQIPIILQKPPLQIFLYLYKTQEYVMRGLSESISCVVWNFNGCIAAENVTTVFPPVPYTGYVQDYSMIAIALPLRSEP